jgi:sigma-B regulation protein RsbU (phosphoserine phosphatase)
MAHQPGRLLTEVNRQISADLEQVEMFITAQIGWLSVRDHTLVLANAGHCPVLHFQHASGEVGHYHGPGVPLGVVADFQYGEQSCDIHPGDALVLLTDGVYEVENSQKEMLGIERFTARLEELWREGRPALTAHALDFVNSFAAGRYASDDRTLLVVRRTG